MQLCNCDRYRVSPTPAEAAYYCCAILCGIYTINSIVGARAVFAFCAPGMLSAQTQ